MDSVAINLDCIVINLVVSVVVSLNIISNLNLTDYVIDEHYFQVMNDVSI